MIENFCLSKKHIEKACMIIFLLEKHMICGENGSNGQLVPCIMFISTKDFSYPRDGGLGG